MATQLLAVGETGKANELLSAERDGCHHTPETSVALAQASARFHEMAGDFPAAVETCETALRALPSDLPRWPADMKPWEDLVSTAVHSLEACGDPLASNACRSTLLALRDLRGALRRSAPEADQKRRASVASISALQRILSARAGRFIETANYVVDMELKQLLVRSTGVRVDLLDRDVVILRYLNEHRQSHEYVTRASLTAALRSAGHYHSSDARFGEMISRMRVRLVGDERRLIIGRRGRLGGYRLEN